MEALPADFEALSRERQAREEVDPLNQVSAGVAAPTVIAIENARLFEALRQSEEQYRMLFNSMDEGFCTIEMIFDDCNRPIDYRFLEVNAAFEKQTGIKDAKGKRMREVAADHEEHWFQIYGDIALTGKPARFENPAEALGRCYDVYAFRVGAPESRRVAIIFNDITERKKAHQHLERIVEERTTQLRSTIAELEAFAYSLSYDMRAPLRATQSYTQMVLDDYGQKLDPQGTEFLKRTVSAAQRMDRLIQDVLTFSRLSRKEIKLEVVDVDKLVREIIQERAEWQAPRVEIRIKTPLLPMVGHDASLTQCVTNLLDNAVKFVASGVTPQVRIWSESAPLPGSVKLCFEDNGMGIPKKAQHRLFQIFERIHGGGDEYQGTGVGLAIVRKAVERMKGQIGVKSEAGKGSLFWIQLPSPPQ